MISKKNKPKFLDTGSTNLVFLYFKLYVDIYATIFTIFVLLVHVKLYWIKCICFM